MTDEQDKKANRVSKNEIVTTAGKRVKVDRKLDEKVVEVQKAGTVCGDVVLWPRDVPQSLYVYPSRCIVYWNVWYILKRRNLSRW